MAKYCPFMLVLMTVFFFFFFFFFTVLSVAENTATCSDCWLSDSDKLARPILREVYDNGRIYDISHRYSKEMAYFEGMGYHLWLQASMKNGSIGNLSELKLNMHAGTHVDAPGHVFDDYFDAGFDVDSLDLDVLNGY